MTRTGSSSQSATAPSPTPDPSAPHTNVLRRLSQGQELVIAAIGVGLALYFIFASSNFATQQNGITLSQFIAPIMFFAVAEVFILILGEIDLSVGEVYVLAPFIVRYAADAGIGVIPGIFIALAVACLIGLINGLVTVKLRVPSFITTLGTTFALEGIILISSNGTELTAAGSGTLAFVLGKGALAEIIWALGAVAVLHVVLRHTTFGLHTVATGGNEVTASEAGVKVGTVKVWCFIICAFLGGLMGLLDGYRIGSLDPATNGLNFMFYGVAAAVIGGTALTGGRGTILGAGIGAVVLGILQDGFNIVGISAFAYFLVLGLAILGAMILNIQLERTRNRGLSGKGSLARLLLRGAGRRQESSRGAAT